MKRVLLNPMVTLRIFPNKDTVIPMINSKKIFPDGKNEYDITTWPSSLKNTIEDDPLILPAIGGIFSYASEVFFLNYLINISSNLRIIFLQMQITKNIVLQAAVSLLY